MDMRFFEINDPAVPAETPQDKVQQSPVLLNQNLHSCLTSYRLLCLTLGSSLPENKKVSL